MKVWQPLFCDLSKSGKHPASMQESKQCGLCKNGNGS